MPREYELFHDPCSYDMWCVRDKDGWGFDSWHFDLKEDAEAFLELLNKAK